MSQITFSFTGPEATTAATTVGSTVNVALVGPETGTTTPDINLFEIVLYADTTAWDGFIAQIDSTDATDTEHSENYSSYAMSWYCNLTGTLNATKGGSGCCLRDRESTEGGGYCIRYNTDSTPKAETLWMVEADFVTATEVSEYILPAGKVVTETVSNVGFETFSCTIQANEWMKCNKMQLWPAASYSGGFRFEGGNRVEAYYFDE